MKEKVVLIGAGSASFTRGLLADLIRRGAAADLALVDVDAEALRVAEGLARKMIAAGHAPIRLNASVDRREALRGATAIICTVGVGGRRAWEQDVFIPRKHGIFQPVGDTVMPGGTSRALRMVPAMVAVAQDVLDLAPDALFFNYGNPMAPVCRGIRKATGAKVTGLCHGVHHVGQYLAKALGVETSRLKYTAVGINHLTWFTEVRADGEDAMPKLRRIAAEKIAEGLSGGSPETANVFSWQLLELFGAFPAVLDRHVTEFFPQFFADGKYYGKTLGVDAYSFEDTIARGDRGYAEMREIALSDRPLPDGYGSQRGGTRPHGSVRRWEGEHERVLEIIEDIRRDAGRVYSVNLPNRGQVPNLPEEAIVESPAVADGSGLRPLTQPPLPAGVVGTLATRFAWVETVAEAALEGSRAKFIQALMLDGAVDSLDTAARLADDLLAAQAKYLPQFSKGKDLTP
jgi:alpha-galactosidase